VLQWGRIQMDADRVCQYRSVKTVVKMPVCEHLWKMNAVSAYFFP
jgi:hypothetical protein